MQTPDKPQTAGTGTGAEDAPLKRRRRKPKKPWRKRHGVIFSFMVLAGTIAFLVPFALALMAGRAVDAPDWVTARVERVLNTSLAGAQIALGPVDVILTDEWEPQIRIESIDLTDQTNLPIADFQNTRVTLSRTELVKGRIAPIDIFVDGAFLSLRREPDGRFDLALENQPADTLQGTGSLADVLDSIDRVFETPELTSVRLLRAEQVTFQYEDVRAAQFWVATGGAMEISQDVDKVELRLGFQLLYGEDTPAQAALSFTSFKGSRRAAIAANIIGLPASDFASQAPELAWLSVINAPVSGAFRAEIDEDGVLSSTNGTLEISAGALQPTEDIRPIGFDGGRAYFGYDPENQHISFDEFSISTEYGRVSADGQAYLLDMENGWPRSMTGQLRLTEFTARLDDVFEEPLELDSSTIDVRLRFDPFTLTIGQAMAKQGESHLRASGEVAATPGGWDVELDLGIDQIGTEDLIANWPVRLVPNTRKWLRENVLSGEISNVNAGLRLHPGGKPLVAAGFEFQNAVIRFMNKMPVVSDAQGYATLIENRFVLVGEGGTVTPPEGGELDVSGTVVSIEDVTLEPPDMDVALQVRGPVHAALSVLDQKPFEFLTKAEQPVDLAEGEAEVEAAILIPLRKELETDDVVFSASARLAGVLSEQLVSGKRLSAQRLTVRADNDQVMVSGEGQITEAGGEDPEVWFDAAWSQQTGREHAGRSRIEGQIELSTDFTEVFRIGLPDGFVSGEGRGDLEINLPPDAPAEFSLVSDLKGLGMRVREVGWSKSASSGGSLQVSGAFSDPVRIDRLALNAPQLQATGAVSLNADNSFREARFAEIKVGSWLDAPVTFTARGAGQSPAVAVTGGTIDIRQTTFGQGGSAGSGSGRNTPVVLALDRLQVTDNIAIHNMRGNLQTAPALSGNFTGSVNGNAPITGTLAPSAEGTAVRIRSDDAGSVMRAAGVFTKLYSGAMEMILVPRPENGVYDGRLTAQNVQVRGAPALADLLGAISVVGLLEQLNGNGIVFGRVESRFVLTPSFVHLIQGSAIGASLGVSMDGIYQLESERLDMRGVISPIYVVNGIGAILTRRGEGLFGFNYRLRGTASDPQVRVNPLSILTPGMFRELFRGRPPEIGPESESPSAPGNGQAGN